jgi:SAM-dependent methyltransferase
MTTVPTWACDSSETMVQMALYDRTGSGYSVTRRPDPRFAAVIDEALHGMASVANIGAGTGSYEPPQTVVAVEPSRVMLNQRPAAAAPAVQAAAECLPIGTAAVDAAMALLTVHHWTDLHQGVAEMLRIARKVVLTWDHNVFRQFWLVREYLPAAAQSHRHQVYGASLPAGATSLSHRRAYDLESRETL